MIETIITDDGSLTAHHKILGDLYHSKRGAIGEARYVYIENALFYFISHKYANPTGQNEKAEDNEIVVFDMGFGAGLNALLTMEMVPVSCSIKYYTIEKYPLSFDEQMQFGYSASPNYRDLLAAPWNSDVRITDNFMIHKIEGDVLQIDKSVVPLIDVVYWDAFSPDTQPQLWTSSMFTTINELMSSQAILTTYSSKGAVKQALRDSGFIIERLPGALGKHHMIRAHKCKISPDPQIVTLPWENSRLY